MLWTRFELALRINLVGISLEEKGSLQEESVVKVEGLLVEEEF